MQPTADSTHLPFSVKSTADLIKRLESLDQGRQFRNFPSLREDLQQATLALWKLIALELSEIAGRETDPHLRRSAERGAIRAWNSARNTRGRS